MTRPLPVAEARPVPYASPVECKLLYTAGDPVLLALRQGTGYAAMVNVTCPAANSRRGRRSTWRCAVRRPKRLACAWHRRRCGCRCCCIGGTRKGSTGSGCSSTPRPTRTATVCRSTLSRTKCGGIGWYPIDALPADTGRYTAAGVHLHRHGIPCAAAVARHRTTRWAPVSAGGKRRTTPTTASTWPNGSTPGTAATPSPATASPATSRDRSPGYSSTSRPSQPRRQSRQRCG